ncbi:MAG TPA: ATP-binding cassette domain-containing protein [Streptosporangiaceae bacterium]|nr:ATP-binding cassette domain-containing protein [Streptosporangiaceae bacterium]
MSTDEGQLELIELRRRFGDTIALDGLSFTVPRGQVFGFLGPNGAGKTTAMRAIVGVAALDSGSVRWNGAPIGNEARRRIGYMPEERGLYPSMKVSEQLEYLARLHGLTAAKAQSATRYWIDRLGLADRSQDKIEALSLGNQQRAQLAAALVHGPELLVLDEPFSGLDPVGVDAMSAVLTERAAAGVTMLFSSHLLDLVEHLCTAVAIIHHGALVAHGTVDELAMGGRLRIAVKVAGDEQARWIAKLPRGTGGLPAGAAVESITDGAATIALACGEDAQAILDLARRSGPVEQFGFVRRRLSEVFRDAVGPGVQGMQAQTRTTMVAAAAGTANPATEAAR